jgi:hypothetical protein
VLSIVRFAVQYSTSVYAPLMFREYNRSPNKSQEKNPLLCSVLNIKERGDLVSGVEYVLGVCHNVAKGDWTRPSGSWWDDGASSESGATS